MIFYSRINFSFVPLLTMVFGESLAEELLLFSPAIASELGQEEGVAGIFVLIVASSFFLPQLFSAREQM